MKYWDSSALVSLVVDEPRSAELRTVYRQDPMIVTWWGTRIECTSGMSRRLREGSLQGADLDRAIARFASLAASWLEVVPGEQVRRRAIRLLRLHPLRAADALQLAAALTAAGEDPHRLDLVCSDDRLSAAAHREGFTVY